MRARLDRWLDWLWLFLAALLFLGALLLPLSTAFALTEEEARLQEAYDSGQIIRLHVLAHSDQPRDQAIKLAVRDALIDAFGDLLAEAGEQGFDAVYDALVENLPAMQAVAQARARELGFEGLVRAEAGVLFLPEKAYGQVTLPAGRYRALRVSLGSAQGQNWWCVLYPRLCLALAGQDEETPEIPPAFQWHTSRIFSQWLLFGQKGANML